MDKNPQCSQDVEQTQKEATSSQKDQTSPAQKTKPQTVLTKEHPAYLEDQPTPKNLTYTLEQPGCSKDQANISEETLPTILITLKKHDSSLLEEHTTLPMIKTDSTVDKSSTKDRSTTEIHIDRTKTNSSLHEEQTTLPVIFIDSTVDKSSSSKEVNTEMYFTTAKDKPSVTEEDTTLPIERIHCPVDESSSSKELKTEIYIDTIRYESTSLEKTTAQKINIASTRNESSDSKNQVDKGGYSGRLYSNNIESVNSSVETAALATSYFVNSNAPLKINSSTQSPTTAQPVSQLPIPPSVTVGTEPASLFLQALAKLNESSLTLSVVSNFKLQSSPNMSRVYKSGDITPPDSLSSAPPTYSFVLRQMAIRRRPRYMGTFIPSPSFVQQTPPPTYTGAYDVYLEPAIPPPPPRAYNFGYTSMPIVCPECGYTGMTVVTSHVTICTHLCAFILCLLCCWICAPLPYLLRSCKDVYHYCRNCRSFLGMYCPTNPEHVYPNV